MKRSAVLAERAAVQVKRRAGLADEARGRREGSAWPGGREPALIVEGAAKAKQGAEPFGTRGRGEGWGRGSLREFDRSRRHEPSRKPIDRLPGRWAIGVVTQDSHFAGSTPDRGSFEARAPQAVPGQA